MHTRIALVAAVLLVAFGGVVAPLAATPAAAQSGPAVGFGDGQTTVAQGDVATIDLQLRNTDQAVLRILSADQQYRATIRVSDGDGDGTVRVRANTFRAGLDAADRFTAAGDADTARLVSESSATDASSRAGRGPPVSLGDGTRVAVPEPAGPLPGSVPGVESPVSPPGDCPVSSPVSKVVHPANEAMPAASPVRTNRRRRRGSIPTERSPDTRTVRPPTRGGESRRSGSPVGVRRPDPNGLPPDGPDWRV